MGSATTPEGNMVTEHPAEQDAVPAPIEPAAAHIAMSAIHESIHNRPEMQLPAVQRAIRRDQIIYQNHEKHKRIAERRLTAIASACARGGYTILAAHNHRTELHRDNRFIHQKEPR